MKGAAARIDDNELPADFVSEATLRVSLAKLPRRPAAGTDVSIRVNNPEGVEPLSKAVKVTFWEPARHARIAAMHKGNPLLAVPKVVQR